MVDFGTSGDAFKTNRQRLEEIDGLDIEDQKWSDYGDLEVVLLIDPGSYREVDEIIKEATRGAAQLEILDLTVQELGDLKMIDE